MTPQKRRLRKTFNRHSRKSVVGPRLQTKKCLDCGVIYASDLCPQCKEIEDRKTKVSDE